MNPIPVRSATESLGIAPQTVTREPRRSRIGRYAGRGRAGRSLRSPEARRTASCCIRSKSSRSQAHPFREGNGRTSKVFMAHVAEQSPYRFDFARVSPEQWNAGSALSRPDLYAYAPDPTSLVPVFAAVTVDRSAPQAGPDRAAQVRSALSASYPRSAADATRQTPQQGTQARRGTAGYRSDRGSGRE